MGDEPTQAEDHEGNEEEIDHQHGTQEAEIPDGLAQLGQRNTQEGRIEQEHQNRIDALLCSWAQGGGSKSE